MPAGGAFVPQVATEVPTIGYGGISEDGVEWRVKLLVKGGVA